jgi:hypothetical protein
LSPLPEIGLGAQRRRFFRHRYVDELVDRGVRQIPPQRPTSA